jgi:hypothetical protein
LVEKRADPDLVDVHALENYPQSAQFFVAQVSQRIEGDAPNAATGPLPILIVLSGPMAFGSGENLHPIELDGKPDAEVFYIRYHSLPPHPPTDPFLEECCGVFDTYAGKCD